MKNQNVLYLTQAAMIAAIYVVFTFLANALGLANGSIQIRFSEALTILPYFTSAAIPGLGIGCLLANLLTGCAPYDILFGTLATLLGAIGTYALRKYQWLTPIPPILANTLIIPFILTNVYGLSGGIPYFMVTIFIGELLSCGILGLSLLITLKKRFKVFSL